MAAAANGGYVMDDEESLPTRPRIQPLPSAPITEEEWEIDEGKKKHTPLTLGERLGLKDFVSMNVWRSSIAELFGTAALVFAIDSIVISSVQADIQMPNLLISVLAAIVTTILLLATHPVSGGHINPVISFSAALVGIISIARAIIYIIAQCLGGVLGALALNAIVSDVIAENTSLGGCTVTIITTGPDGTVVMGLETGQALWIEIICTSFFLFASIWMAFDQRQSKELGAVKIFSIIGIVLGVLGFISTTITGEKGYSGAGLNPARCLGPAIVRGGHLWNGHWVFWVGPLIACFGFYLYTKMIPGQHFHRDGYKHDFFKVVKAFTGPN